MKNLLNKYRSDLEKIYNFDFVDSIIIFGSYANNNYNCNSDLDICVITKSNLNMNKKNKIYFYKTDELDINIFDDLGLPMQYKIMTYGVVFKSKINLNTLKHNITNQWFDFRPKLNRIYIRKGLLPII
ncbi:MAG: nucleotidyltransferase domain-containing protein [Nanoarchaeota archaeon]